MEIRINVTDGFVGSVAKTFVGTSIAIIVIDAIKKKINKNRDTDN